MRALALALIAGLIAGAGALGWAAQQPATPVDAATREAAYRAHNLGVTRLEQFDFAGAAAAFRQALETDSQLAMARLNLAIALFYGGDAAAARRELTLARPGLPDRPHTDYLLGLIARMDGNSDEAIQAFARVQLLDPSDAGTAINLGQLYGQAQRYDEATAMFRRALEVEPFNATAVYGLATALLRAGRTEEGTAAMTRFERLRESAYAITYAPTYLEQGRYAEAIASTGAEPGLVDTRVPEVGFATGMTGTTGTTGTVALFDFDADGDLDLAESDTRGLRLSRNDDGHFVDVSVEMLGAVAQDPASASVAGDFDNDGHTDLLILRPDGVTLLRRDPAGAFVDATAGAGLDPITGRPQSAAWLDADHDGDLDLFVGTAGTAGARLFRNNGNGRFTDITGEAGLAAVTDVRAVVPADYDNRRDVDLLLIANTGAPLLFRNLRDGAFRDVTAEVGFPLEDGAGMAAIGDVNKDGYPDVFVTRESGPGAFAASDGRGGFDVSTVPPGAANARAAQWLDYDSDGLLDLFLLTTGGPRLLRHIGGDWIDVTARAIAPAMAAALLDATSLATGDLNGDGHVDVVARGPSGLSVWLNDAGGGARALTVQLAARVSNRSAVGARVELRAGSLRQQVITYAATPAPAPAGVQFGLGDREGADVVRVLWPSGILQAETAAAPALAPLRGVVPVEELERKPSSCPYLYTWNGERFEFITDFLGGGEMGYWLAPGVRNTPDPDEYVRIDGRQLRPRDGRYELRITNELEEALFLDRAELIAVSHPANVEVYPNEGLVSAPRPFRLYTTRDAQPPLAATDDRGRDVLDRIRHVDRRYADDLPLAPVRGYADAHTLTLTLPPASPGGQRLLLLTGWTDYAFSGDNVAAHQAGLRLLPPSLEVRDPDGRWRTVIEDLGIPVGRPQTVVVELGDRVPAAARDVRISTSMRVYWDQVLVDSSEASAPYALTRLEAVAADLRWRGFSAEAPPDGREPYTYDYSRVSLVSPWKLMPGRYTREGDVRELLLRTDDMFVVSRTGDEIALAFDATALPPLPEGWTRTFLLYAGGFSKEMNWHSASPDALLPLPFHGMTRYPYEAPEGYPSTPAHREYLERYNTRVVPRAIPPL